jgi:hypothetical protein
MGSGSMAARDLALASAARKVRGPELIWDDVDDVGPGDPAADTAAVEKAPAPPLRAAE